MNPQSDPAPGLRLPQPSMTPGVAQPFSMPSMPAQSGSQPSVSYQGAQVIGSRPSAALPPQAPQALEPSPSAFTELPAAQAPGDSTMHHRPVTLTPMVNPSVQPQAVQPASPQAGAPQVQVPVFIEPTQPVPAIAPPAEDNDDALDEQWVEKAKTTLDQYKADPYMQSRAFSKLKADYMQARHSKILKVEE